MPDMALPDEQVKIYEEVKFTEFLNFSLSHPTINQQPNQQTVMYCSIRMII